MNLRSVRTRFVIGIKKCWTSENVHARFGFARSADIFFGQCFGQAITYNKVQAIFDRIGKYMEYD